MWQNYDRKPLHQQYRKAWKHTRTLWICTAEGLQGDYSLLWSLWKLRGLTTAWWGEDSGLKVNWRDEDGSVYLCKGVQGWPGQRESSREHTRSHRSLAHTGQNPHWTLVPSHPATWAGYWSFLGLTALANTQRDSDTSPERCRFWETLSGMPLVYPRAEGVFKRTVSVGLTTRPIRISWSPQHWQGRGWFIRKEQN